MGLNVDIAVSSCSVESNFVCWSCMVFSDTLNDQTNGGRGKIYGDGTHWNGQIAKKRRRNCVWCFNFRTVPLVSFYYFYVPLTTNYCSWIEAALHVQVTVNMYLVSNLTLQWAEGTKPICLQTSSVLVEIHLWPQ